MAPFAWIDTPWGPALHCEPMHSLAHHMFSARGLDVPHADAGTGWGPLSAWLGVEESHVWRMRQVHGVTVHTDGVACCDGGWPEGDLLATDRTDVALAVRTADCVPILYADDRTGAVAAVHAGWRGSVAGAAPRMVEVLASRFGSRPEDLEVAIGPSIGPESYEVGPEVGTAFSAAWPEDVARGTWISSSAPACFPRASTSPGCVPRRTRRCSTRTASTVQMPVGWSPRFVLWSRDAVLGHRSPGAKVAPAVRPHRRRPVSPGRNRTEAPTPDWPWAAAEC
jgi:Multi-copper polyphenol oxidoreductase laccase